jgi:Fe-S cluster assembly scaffold protein SufB
LPKETLLNEGFETYTIKPNGSHEYLITEEVLLEASEKMILFLVEERADIQVKLNIRLFKGTFTLKICFKLFAPNTTAEIKGICQLYNDAILHLQTDQIHSGEFTNSNLRIHTVVHNQARFIATSSIVIEPKNNGCRAEQRHKVLLVDKNAYAQVEPILEVSPNLVNCAHGVAIGPLSKTDLFYLTSRGLSYTQAQKLLIQAYLDILT